MIIVQDGAESGQADYSYAEIISGGGALTVDPFTRPGGGGSFAYKFACQTPGTVSIATVISKAAALGDFHGSAWFHVPAGGAPSAEVRILQISNANSPQMVITLDASLTLRLKNSNEATTYGTVASAVSEGTAFQLEIRVDNTAGATSANIEARVNGTSFGATTGISVNVLNGLIIGFHTTSVTGTILADDIMLIDATGSAPHGQVGNYTIASMSVDGDGTLVGTQGADWDTGPTPSQTMFEQIDEPAPSNDLTDYIALLVASSNPTNRTLDFTLQSAASVGISTDDTIGAIGVGVRVRGATAAACQHVRRIKSQPGGTVVEATSTGIASTAWVTNDDSGISFVKASQPLIHADPQTGGPLTAALLDTMQIGVRAPDATPAVWISKIWLSVSFIPTSPPGGGAEGSGVATLALSATGRGARESAGTGIVSLALSATGAGATSHIGGGTATLALSATAHGVVVATGAGVGQLALSATGQGRTTHAGVGSAGLALSATGTGATAARGSGVAALALSAVGRGVSVGGFGAGVATLGLSAQGRGRTAHQGSGVALLGLSAIGTGEAVEITGGAGTAVLLLTATGKGWTQATGSGIATLALSADGRGATEHVGHGTATLLLFAEGRSTTQPVTMADASWRRVGKVTRSDRTGTVSRPSRRGRAA